MTSVASRRIRWVLFIVGCLTVLFVALSTSAWAYPPPTSESEPFVRFSCARCHATDSVAAPGEGSGPHGGYTTTTLKCSLCHSVHMAGSPLLLAGPTVSASCLSCHDGTGATVGVYTTIAAHDALGAAAVKAEHSCDTTSVIPGASADLDHVMTCADCHSAHGANTVQPFMRDSGFAGSTFVGGAGQPVVSDCLLRNDVNGVVGDYPEYGALWCSSCHDERHSDSTVVNHPVDADTNWGYGDVVSTLLPTSWYDYPFGATATGMGRTNGGYVMAPVTVDDGDGRVEVRRDPMCQQCHEDARDVMQPFQGDYTHRGVTDPLDPAFDPWLAPVNPEYLTFPHQTTNANMVIETGDDLCLNCHELTTLP